jgi:meckelin
MVYDTGAGANCQCPTGFTNSDGTCLYNSHPGDTITAAGASTVTYKTLGTTINSWIFDHYFLTSAKKCAFESNRTACQVLANLCVLQGYDGSTKACSTYFGLGTSVPTLTYSDDSTLRTTEFTASTGSFIPLYLATWTLNGTFLGYQTLSTQLTVCPGDPGNQTVFLKAGYDWTTSCKYLLANLLTPGRETLFYELYLKSGTSMKSVPVQLSSASSKYVRRFFIIDNVSGKESSSAQPTVIRVASSAVLHMKLTTTDSATTQMYLKVQYAEKNALALSLPTSDPNTVTATSSGGSSQQTTMGSEYTMDWSEFRTRLMIALIFVAILILIVWAFRMFIFVRCRQNSNIDGEWLLRGILGLASTAADFLFLFLFAVALYVWIVYKNQPQVSLLLPPDSELTLYLAILAFCLAGKVLYLGVIVWVQTRYDIFFIDWEKSRGRFASLKPGQRGKMAPVSIWRTLFIANEWNEMQTVRRISLELTLLLMVLILVGFDYIKWASTAPSMSDTTTTATHSLLRFAVTTLFWIILSCGQMVLNWAVVHRFISNPLTDFVDLVSLANISVFLLRESQHGYYIHGRSVHPHADATIIELRNNMQKEEDNLVAQRGMTPDSDCQTFEIFITPDVRREFNETLLIPIAQNILNMQNQVSVRGAAGRPSTNKSRLPPMDLIRGYIAMNRFLSSFIDRIQTSPDQVRERTFWHRAFGVPPDVMAINKDIFFVDEPTCFESLISFGVEWHLLLFNILLFSVVDWAMQNVVAAALIVWGVDKVYAFLRNWLGEMNLSMKTLIDKRFML